MSLGSDVQLLHESAFFRGFEDDHLRLIAFSAENRHVRKDEVVVEAGRPQHSAYLVSDGLLLARSDRRGGEEEGRPARRFERGALIGDLALITEMKAHETIVAAENSSVLQIRRSMFKRLLDEYPDIAEALRDKLTEGLADTVEEIKRAGLRLGTAGS
ncbi:cyclic nucleotide-binding domain-containing protein [Afifella sp. JA880]|uniref:Crp/Fnr family transcriptional regulator n=1 Tax=Afifella sp. JA880 TaxID=2975280 RepID=UPI0021BBA203|nr:cyclic nucleotide-binding domain-containing protein [Afifella sp. JA880]MCT8268696.1 cyclic nucleotide-binding domain-containing protein [Afifella sp. JA880]